MVNTKSKVVKRDQLHNAYCLCVHCVIDYRIYIFKGRCAILSTYDIFNRRIWYLWYDWRETDVENSNITTIAFRSKSRTNAQPRLVWFVLECTEWTLTSVSCSRRLHKVCPEWHSNMCVDGGGSHSFACYWDLCSKLYSIWTWNTFIIASIANVYTNNLNARKLVLLSINCNNFLLNSQWVAPIIPQPCHLYSICHGYWAIIHIPYLKRDS